MQQEGVFGQASHLFFHPCIEAHGGDAVDISGSRPECEPAEQMGGRLSRRES